MNKIALVTGGTRGIGLAVVEKLAQAGAKVAILASNKEKVEETVINLQEKYQTDFFGVAANVADYNQVESGIRAVSEAWGNIDILVNNAGITKDALFLRLAEDNWDLVIDVNLKGVYNCTKVVFPAMVKKRYGRIINITSIVGITGNVGQANYAAAKAGVIGLTKTLAKEGAPFNILCNAVAPGFIETQMTQAIPEKIITEIKKNIPLKSLGKPEDVAYAVAFLASEANQYLTGQVINVDGGLAM